MIPLRLTLIAAAVLAAHTARADVADVAEQAAAPAIQQVEIKGSAARYDARRDDTASKTVINAEEIQKYGDTSINDVLKRVPGITVGGAAGRSGGEIRMRGLGSGYTQILINGERAPAGFSIDTLAPEVIERIEVLRAASAEFSTQSIAGTINIVLKKALKSAQHEIKISEAKSATMSSPSASLQMSDKDGSLSYSLGGNAWRYGYNRVNPSYDSGTAPDGTPNLSRTTSTHELGRSQGFNLSPRLNWKLDGGDTMAWQNFFNQNQFANTSHARTITTLGAGPDYDRIDGTYSNHSAFGRSDINWVHNLGDGAKLDLKAAVSDNRNTSDSRQQGYTQSVGPGPDLFRYVHGASSEQGFSSTGKYSTPLRFGTGSDGSGGGGNDPSEHALSLGWDAGVTRRDDLRIQRDAPLPGATPVNSDEGYAAQVKRLALFGQDEWSVTPLWSIYAGLRWEGLDTSAEGGGFDAVQSRSSVLSPLLQTLIKLPNQKDQLRLALTRTYKAPAASALVPRRFTSTNNTPTEPDRRGNPNLKPELAIGLDASFEHYWGEGGLLSASASMRRIENYTHQGLLYEDQRWISTAINDGRAETHGVELEAKFPLRALDPAAPALDLRASLSRNWSRVESVPGPDNRLDQQTPLSATVGVDYKSRDGQFSTGSNFSFRNGGPVRQSEQQGGYASVRRDLDVYALWKLDPQNNLRVAVSNLLAQDYTTESLYTDASGSLNRTWVANGETQLRVTVERRF
jgi:outer membrane receptor protein involved in Fe transport